jgi:peptidoglycan/xylan/chitin deacetylase (PgdA/CDA1 family)
VMARLSSSSLLLAILLCFVLASFSAIPHVNASSTRYVFIRFDDGYQDQYVSARPVLNYYGYKASYFGIASCLQNVTIPDKVSYTYECMSWQEIQNLYSKGNEIVDHGEYEADMNHLSSSAEYYQIVTSRQAFLDHGITRLPDYSLPEGSGFTNSSLLSYIYNAGFEHAWGAYPPYGISNYNTIGTVFYPFDWIDNDLSMSAFKADVSHASSTFAVGLEFHLVLTNAAQVGSSNPYSISLSLFKSMIAYLHNKGFTVVLATKLPNYNGGVSSGTVSISTSSVSLQPGQTTQTSITIYNTESQPVTLQSITNFDSSGYPNLVGWFTNGSPFPDTLASGSSLTVAITVQASSSTTAGSYQITGQINTNTSVAPTFSIPITVS